MRYAIYLTPPPGAPLLAAAEAWLGRSAFSPARLTPAAPAAARSEVPARYGFHATLKAPFALRDGVAEADLRAAFEAFAGGPLDVVLGIVSLGDFLALVSPEPALGALADRAVRHFEPLRAPLTAAERARRNPDVLDARGVALLEEWGYPHVFERFRFHMTLTGGIAAGDMAPVHAAAAAHFAGLLMRPDRLVPAVFAEHEPGGPFEVVAIAADAPAAAGTAGAAAAGTAGAATAGTAGAAAAGTTRAGEMR